MLAITSELLQHTLLYRPCPAAGHSCCDSREDLDEDVQHRDHDLGHLVGQPRGQQSILRDSKGQCAWTGWSGGNDGGEEEMVRPSIL